MHRVEIAFRSLAVLKILFINYSLTFLFGFFFCLFVLEARAFTITCVFPVSPPQFSSEERKNIMTP